MQYAFCVIVQVAGSPGPRPGLPDILDAGSVTQYGPFADLALPFLASHRKPYPKTYTVLTGFEATVDDLLP